MNVSPCVCVCLSHSGFLDSEPLREADEDLVSEVNLNTSMMTEEEREEIQQELAKVCCHTRSFQAHAQREQEVLGLDCMK